MSRPIYGHVSSPSDIRKINRQIRSQLRNARSRARATELVRRSRYLVTLTHSPAWRNIDGRLRPVAIEEYVKTLKVANSLVNKGRIPGPPYTSKYLKRKTKKSRRGRKKGRRGRR